MILHIDMDAFYASIEQRDHPELKGRPVIVGGSTGRGVVAAASYEAREYGVRSAMPGKRAKELCPHAVFMKGRLSDYSNVGRQVREIFARYTPIIQPLSLDEAFLDVAGTERLHGDAISIGREIKQAIASELQLTASVGVAPRKFVAKIASDLEKPSGFVVVQESELISFLDPLPVSRLWGVGKVGGRRLARLGLKTIRDIRRYDQDLLISNLGDWGQHLWNLANGNDARPVVTDRSAKQISHERTFSSDENDPDFLHAVVCHLCEQTAMRLRRSERKASTVVLKYRREDFRTFSKSRTLDAPSDSTSELMQVACELLKLHRHDQPRPVRLIGVSLTGFVGLDTPQQLSLFDDQDNKRAERKIDQVVDQLANQLGDASVYRAASHSWRKRK